MWAFVTLQLINETVGLQKTPNIMIKKEKRKKNVSWKKQIGRC